VSTPPIEISPQELKSLLDQGVSVRLIDVREPEEERICRIDGAVLMPMRGIPERLSELKSPELKSGEPAPIAFCHHGVRSLRVAEWLRAQGIEGARSLAGGIDRWSLEIDPSVARY
jgi:rhodanese-related sulfurtransferase